MDPPLDQASLENSPAPFPIDILYLHGDLGPPGWWCRGRRVLIDLRDQGVVSASSGSARAEVDVITHLFRETSFDTAMVAGRYTLLGRGTEAVFDAAGGAPSCGCLQFWRPREAASVGGGRTITTVRHP
jgi:hypothetical protein